MSYQEFQKRIKKILEEKFAGNAAVIISPVLKNNGIERIGLSIQGNESNVCPVIYLEYYYESYQSGREFDDIVKEIEGEKKKNCISGMVDMSFFKDWSVAQGKITLKLINYEENKKLLERLPHRKFLDMAIVYQYVMETGQKESATVLINYFHMKIWEVQERDLYECACRNYRKLTPVMVENIKCVIAELLEESMLDIPLDEGEDMAPLYVVTNRAKLNGAASMVFISELRDSSDVFEQDLYILPSSIHEVLVLPVQYADIKELRWMVKEVNGTLLPEEKLSDQVYRYCCKSGKIEIV